MTTHDTLHVLRAASPTRSHLDMREDARDALRALGVPVVGVYVGGCVARGEGSSFRAMAHTHTHPTDSWQGWICIRSARRVLTASGKPTRILLHEAAHVLAPKAAHGSVAFVKALAAVGIRTDTYSRAGRARKRK